MASLSLSATTTRPANLILGFPPRALIPTINAVKLRTWVSPPSSTLRLKQENQRQLIVFATNSNSSAADEETPNEEPTSKAGQGPPFLTILAGAIVFFSVCWLIGSIVIWLVSLIVNVITPK